jgi:hypothetical protein
VLVGPARTGFSAIGATILEQQLLVQYRAKTRAESDGMSHPKIRSADFARVHFEETQSQKLIASASPVHHDARQ